MEKFKGPLMAEVFFPVFQNFNFFFKWLQCDVANVERNKVMKFELILSIQGGITRDCLPGGGRNGTKKNDSLRNKGCVHEALLAWNLITSHSETIPKLLNLKCLFVCLLIQHTQKCLELSVPNFHHSLIKRETHFVLNVKAAGVTKMDIPSKT